MCFPRSRLSVSSALTPYFVESFIEIMPLSGWPRVGPSLQFVQSNLQVSLITDASKLFFMSPIVHSRYRCVFSKPTPLWWLSAVQWGWGQWKRGQASALVALVVM